MGDSSDSPQRIDGMTGTVVRGPFGTGSKSARDAVWLDTAERSPGAEAKGRPNLRRPGAR